MRKFWSNVYKISLVKTIDNHTNKIKHITILDNNAFASKCVTSQRIFSRQYHEIDPREIPHVSVTQMKRLLEIHGYSVKDGYACLITSCKLCPSAAKESKLFINKVTGFYLCDNCRASGQWSSLESQLQTKDKEKLKELAMNNLRSKQDNSKWLQLCEKSLSLSSVSENVRNKIMKTFELDGLSKNMIENLNILVDSTHNTLYFPLKNVHGNIIGFKEMSATGEEITVPSSNCSGIIKLSYGDKAISSDAPEVAVIVHSVKDFLAISMNDMPFDKICLPHGLLSLPQELLPLLESYKKVILWFGNHPTTLDSAKNFAKKLGEKRCYFVRPVENQPAPHVAHKLKLNFLEIVNASQPIWHDFVTTFSSLRKDLLAELQNKDSTQGVRWQRFPALTNILKGHRRGELTVITGPTGCGKTTFMSEYSLDLAMQGVTTLWGSFEIRNHRLARTMLQQYSMLPLEHHLEDFDSWADKFEKLPLFFLTFYGQQNLKLVMEAVEHATYVNDVAHVIIDNVQFMLGLGEKENQYIDRFYRQDLVVSSFRTFATKRNCHVTLVIHPRKEREGEQLSANSIFGSAKASQEADNIFILQQRSTYHAEPQKHLQVAKNRFSGDLGLVTLNFDPSSRSFSKAIQSNKEKKDSNSPFPF